MAVPQNFRTSFNGFNRDDVVNYISYITTKHENQINQLNSELDQLRQELAEIPAAPVVDEKELDELRAEIAALKAQLQDKDETIAQLKAQSAAPAVSPLTEQELNAYRRAENAERRAMERVDQMYAQATGVLADTVSRLEENSGHVAQLADLVRADLTKLEAAIIQSKAVLSDSAAVLSAIHPE